MKRRWTLGILALLATALLLAGVARAQTSASFDLSWHALPGGGNRSASASYALYSTVGQGAVGYSTGATLGMETGYWHNWADRMVYLPLVTRGL